MMRREFVAGLAGAAAWSLGARAQEPSMPVIGFIHSQLADGYGDRLRPFREGLKDSGHVEGGTVLVEYHSAEGRSDQLRSLISSLISRPVAMLTGNTAAMLAA